MQMDQSPETFALERRKGAALISGKRVKNCCTSFSSSSSSSFRNCPRFSHKVARRDMEQKYRIYGKVLLSTPQDTSGMYRPTCPFLPRSARDDGPRWVDGWSLIRARIRICRGAAKNGSPAHSHTSFFLHLRGFPFSFIGLGQRKIASEMGREENHFTVVAQPESIEFQSLPLAASPPPFRRRANVCEAAGSNRASMMAFG